MKLVLFLHKQQYTNVNEEEVNIINISKGRASCYQSVYSSKNLLADILSVTECHCLASLVISLKVNTGDAQDTQCSYACGHARGGKK